MFIREMCRLPKIEKCSRIFRPWDLENQDATVSTTTKEEIKKENSENPIEKVKKNKCESVNETSSSSFSSAISNYPVVPQDLVQPYPDYSFYPEIAHHLNSGIVPNDPLILEGLANGYTFEEYARFLEQEHQTKILSSKKKRPKKYKCPHCDVGFSNNGQLKGHIRIHTGERPFKCDEKDCGKTFTRNEELTRHKRIHSGLRPFPCTQCGKRFGRKDHLKKHCRTHFQTRGVFALPVMLPYDAWTAHYPFVAPLPGLY